MVDPASAAAVVVAIIAALGGWSAQRAAAKAVKYNADAARSNSKESAEVEAFNRARSMDLRTIERQNAEIDDLTNDLIAVKKRLDASEKKNADQQVIIRALRRKETENPGGTDA